MSRLILVLSCAFLLTAAYFALRARPAEQPMPAAVSPPRPVERPLATMPAAAHEDRAAPAPPASDAAPRVAPLTAIVPERTRITWAHDLRDEARARAAAARAALATSPNSVAALRDLYEASRALGDNREALAALSRLSELTPEDVLLREALASEAIRQRRFLLAIEPLRQIVAERPDNAAAWHNFAIAHQALGHLAEAREAWTQVLRVRPDDVEALSRRAEVLLDLAEWSAAADDLEQELATLAGPDATPTDQRTRDRQVGALLNLALARLAGGDLPAAEAAARQALGQMPDAVPTLVRLGEILVEKSRDLSFTPSVRAAARDEAATLLRRALALDADQPDIAALLEELSGGSTNSSAPPAASAPPER